MTQEQFLGAMRARVNVLAHRQIVSTLPINQPMDRALPSISPNELAELIKAVAILEDAQANSNLYTRNTSNEEDDDQW